MREKRTIIAWLMMVMLLSALMPVSSWAADPNNDAEIATWAGFRKGAATFTFEDGAPCHITDVAPMFDKYGYKASFYLVVNWNPNWSGFQSLADNGHEIGSHSNSHPYNMSGEEASSKKNIEDRITSQYGCITVAYPNGTVPNESAVLNNYIAGRVYNGSWYGISDRMSKDGPSNWCKVPALMTGTEGQIKSTDDFTNQMQAAVSEKGWVVFATTGLLGKINGSATYSPTDPAAIEGALIWAKQNDNDIWVTTLGNAAMYIKERKASVLKKTEGSAESMTFRLTHNIADTVCSYSYPLSIRVPLPADWPTKVNVRQGKDTLEAKVDGGWIYFDAVPNGSDIVIEGKCQINGHDMTEIAEVAPTCTKDGTKAYWKCKDCGKMFSDKDGANEITSPEGILAKGHILEKTPEVKAACSTDGTKAYWTCKTCKKMFSDQDGKTEITKPEVIQKTGHSWGEWKTTKEATYNVEGEEQRICRNDTSHVEKRVISKKVKQTSTTPTTDITTQTKTTLSAENDGSATPTAREQEKTILSLKTDSDPAGSTYGLLQARMKKVTKNSITLQWKKISGAKYTIYGNKCGKKNRYKKIKTVTKTSFTQKKLKKGKYYKYLIVAVKNGKAIATSKTIHVATTGGKVGNTKTVKARKNKLSVKVGKTGRIKVSTTPANKKLKVKKHRAIAFESSNSKIATVSDEGIVTGVRSGTCYVYAYAQNGVMAKVTVKVG